MATSPIRFEPSGAARVDLKYVVVVAVLLVVIIVVLTQLWLTERDRRMTAEERLTELYLREQLRAAVGNPPATQPASSSPAATAAP